MSSENDARLGYQLKLAQHALQRAMEDALRPLGLTLSQFSVLNQIDQILGQTNADLARKAFITPQSMQGVLANLERAGLITRRADEDHGRRQIAQLTKSGIRELERARLAVRAIDEKLAEVIAPLDREDVVEMFKRIQTRISDA